MKISTSHLRSSLAGTINNRPRPRVGNRAAPVILPIAPETLVINPDMLSELTIGGIETVKIWVSLQPASHFGMSNTYHPVNKFHEQRIQWPLQICNRNNLIQAILCLKGNRNICSVQNQLKRACQSFSTQFVWTYNCRWKRIPPQTEASKHHHLMEDK